MNNFQSAYIQVLKSIDAEDLTHTQIHWLLYYCNHLSEQTIEYIELAKSYRAMLDDHSYSNNFKEIYDTSSIPEIYRDNIIWLRHPSECKPGSCTAYHKEYCDNKKALLSSAIESLSKSAPIWEQPDKHVRTIPSLDSSIRHLLKLEPSARTNARHLNVMLDFMSDIILAATKIGHPFTTALPTLLSLIPKLGNILDILTVDDWKTKFVHNHTPYISSDIYQQLILQLTNDWYAAVTRELGQPLFVGKAKPFVENVLILNAHQELLNLPQVRLYLCGHEAVWRDLAVQAYNETGDHRFLLAVSCPDVNNAKRILRLVPDATNILEVM